MFDIGWQELLLISVVALIVVGPKDLPKVLRTGARLLNKVRAMSRDFQSGLAEMAREAELDDIKRTVDKATRFDPADELKRAVDPTGRFTDDFDPAEFNRKIKEAVEGGPPTGPARPQPTASPAAAPPAVPPEIAPASIAAAAPAAAAPPAAPDAAAPPAAPHAAAGR